MRCRAFGLCSVAFSIGPTHTGDVITLSLDTWISLVVLVSALSGFYVALRREMHGLEASLRTEFRSEISRLENHLIRLDDRVYALASGGRPVPDDQ